MQSKNIYELLEQFQSDGFSLDSLAAITNVPAALIARCANREKITHEETMLLGNVLSFLGLMYMVDTADATYLRESYSALEHFYHIPQQAVASYLGISSSEFQQFLDAPESLPNSQKLLMKFTHLKTIILQRAGTE